LGADVSYGEETMISFFWYGRKIMIQGFIFVLGRYAAGVFLWITGRWPGRNKDGSYIDDADAP
jgi:hypothetical protein